MSCGELPRRVVLICVLAGLCAEGVFGQEPNASQEQNPDQTQSLKEKTKGTETPSSSTSQEAQQDEMTAVPNRPTFASTAETVQRGVFEVEYGFELANSHQNLNGLLKWGVFKNLELWFLNVPIERDSAVTGRGDCGAGFKYRMVSQSKKLPTTSVLYVATLPTATAELGTGALGHSVQLLLSKDFGKHHFDAN